MIFAWQLERSPLRLVLKRTKLGAHHLAYILFGLSISYKCHRNFNLIFALNIGKQKTTFHYSLLTVICFIMSGWAANIISSSMLCAWALCLQQLHDFDPQFLTLLDALAEHLPAKIRESEGLQSNVKHIIDQEKTQFH